MFSSSIQTMGDNADAPDYVYYNADIVNNTTQNTFGGTAVKDPQIRFNETRDTALIRNAADYYFSIIRFTMDGANKDLPLFIPSIQEGTGQTNPNLSVYALSVGYQQAFTNATQTFTLTSLPPPRYIQYVPETQNASAAPTPRLLSAQTFQGQYVNTRGYQLDDIVSLIPANPLYNSWLDAPFYSPITPLPWNGKASYSAGSAVQYNSKWYFSNVAVPSPPLNTQNPDPSLGGSWTLGTPINGSPFYQLPNVSPYWVLVDNAQGQSQDLTTRYYWVYTFQHWVDLWNITMLNPASLGDAPDATNATSTCAYQDTYNYLFAAFSASPLTAGYTFPYPTFGDFVNTVYPPVMIYDPATFKFIIQADSNGFGDRIQNYFPTPEASPVIGLPTPPKARLFFNANMFGLFSNFNNIYYNDAGVQAVSAYPTQNVPDGYVNEILFTNKFYRNIADYRIAPYAGVPPLGYVPTSLQRVYWLAEQDYSSVDSLWSPISSLVFTSTLLPVKTEATGAPVVLGQGNLGFSAPTVQSAFQPIITDIALDTSLTGGSAAYRQFIYYAPSAEYRLSDFSSSKQDIRNIDIQVFWKNRLDNQLYPINMFNLSSVSIKVMFKHKDADR